jgi:hypothetical protein
MESSGSADPALRAARPPVTSGPHVRRQTPVGGQHREPRPAEWNNPVRQRGPAAFWNDATVTRSATGAACTRPATRTRAKSSRRPRRPGDPRARRSAPRGRRDWCERPAAHPAIDAIADGDRARPPSWSKGPSPTADRLDRYSPRFRHRGGPFAARAPTRACAVERACWPELSVRGRAAGQRLRTGGRHFVAGNALTQEMI